MDGAGGYRRRPGPTKRGATEGQAGLFHSIGTFAGSIIEAVWPLGCSIRRNMLPVLSSVSWFVATDTEAVGS